MGNLEPSARVDDTHENYYYHYAGVLAKVFDVDPMIVAQLCNLDYVRLPHTKKDQPLSNYVQLLTATDKGESTMTELLSFMTDFGDPDYREPYQHTEQDRGRLRKAIYDIASKHGSAACYFKWVSLRLWQKESYLEETYPNYLLLLQKRIDAFKSGKQGYVFLHVKDGRAIYTR